MPKIVQEGVLIYNSEDLEVKKLGEKYDNTLKSIPYQTPIYDVTESGTRLYFEDKYYDLQIFGGHNLQNLMGAMRIGEAIGINPHSFFESVKTFKGAGKRLQKIAESKNFTMFKDFAHSPSKLTATTRAVKEQFSSRKVIACMELHTFSSLKKEFLSHYKGAMDQADEAIVYFSHEVVKHKKLEPITADMVKNAFGGNVKVMTETSEVLNYINDQKWNDSVLLMMSSGTFDGINYEGLGEEIISSL